MIHQDGQKSPMKNPHFHVTISIFYLSFSLLNFLSLSGVSVKIFPIFGAAKPELRESSSLPPFGVARTAGEPKGLERRQHPAPS
jgi:hypothetical protein